MFDNSSSFIKPLGKIINDNGLNIIVNDYIQCSYNSKTCMDLVMVNDKYI